MTSKRPRVLLSYFFGPRAIPLGWSCARALEALGCEVDRFDSGVESPVDRWVFRPVNKLAWNLGLRSLDVSTDSPWNNQNYRQARLAEAVERFRPELLLVIRGHGFGAPFLRGLKTQYGVGKTIGWWVRGPEWFDMMRDEARAYDHYFCIHKEGYGETDPIIPFPALAVDDVLYRKLDLGGGRGVGPEVVFVGGWTPQRQQILERLLDFPLTIYGQRWRKHNVVKPRLLARIRGSGIWGEALIRLYSAAKIVLNITRWDASQHSGLNLRVFDVPACGAFFLTDYSEQLAEYFRLGIDIETFKDLPELQDKLRFYLAHDEARERIARSGHEKVQSFGTYRDKMRAMLDMVATAGERS